MTLRITPARKELLRAVADGEVWDRYYDSQGWRAFWDRGPGGVNGRRFAHPTAAILSLRAHGFVKPGPKGIRWHQDVPWLITDAGTAVLAKTDGAT